MSPGRARREATRAWALRSCARPRCWGLLALTVLLLAGRPALAQSALFLSDGPAWTHYLCDSSEPDPAGAASIQGTHCYASLTVPGGATLTVTNVSSAAGAPQDAPRGALLALVNGPCSILGTINAAASNTGYSNGGGSGGGGGGSATANGGQVGLLAAVFGNGGFVTTAAGGLGGNAGQSGAAGSTPTPASQKWSWNSGLAFGVPGGSAGGAGASGQGAAAGGGGGGAVMLVCTTLDFEGAINVTGGAGMAGAQGGGGGGGGGGGVVMLATPDYLATSGTINLNGGMGGPGDSGAGAGGAGGAGWLKQFTLN